MAPRKKTAKPEAVNANAEDNLSGLSLKDKIEIAKTIAMDSNARNSDRLDALELLLDIEGSQAKQDPVFHVHLDQEYIAGYNNIVAIPAPPPVETVVKAGADVVE